MITRLDFPKRRSYLVRNVYESPAQILTDEEAKLTQLDLYLNNLGRGVMLKVNAFSEHIHVSTYDSKYFCSGRGGPERSIIICPSPSKSLSLVWPTPFYLHRWRGGSQFCVCWLLLRLLSTAAPCISLLSLSAATMIKTLHTKIANSLSFAFEATLTISFGFWPGHSAVSAFAFWVEGADSDILSNRPSSLH